MIERKAKIYMFLTTAATCPQGDVCRKRSPKSMKTKDCQHLAGIKQTPDGLMVECKLAD